MTANSLTNGQKGESTLKSSHHKRSIEEAQEKIYRFLLEIVKTWPPDQVLQEFNRLFIQQLDSVSSDSVQGIYKIVLTSDEEEFRNTIKRCCYILVNNWEAKRQYSYIQKLIELFANPKIGRYSVSPTVSRLKTWLKNFIDSKDYQDLKLFASRHEEQDGWLNRYSSYLLVAQYADPQNPVEQREAARCRAKQLKQQFKFDLAMYIARSQSVTAIDRYKNPTVLGDEVLRLIKTIVVKRGAFSYANIANIFLNQTQNQTYKEFKQSLQKYLIYSVGDKEFVETLKNKLSENLNSLYEKYNEQSLTDALLLRTCNRIIDYLTTENHCEPSQLFVLLMSQGNALTLVIVLLKIILICRYARTHLESCIADLIRYYENSSEKDCEWLINFLEFFNITFAIYADNVQYNLIKMPDGCKPSQAAVDLDSYRVFSQLKEDSKLEVLPEPPL